MLGILDGLSEEQMRRPVLPSGWSCLGMVKHLALADEHYWFRSIVGGETLDFFPPGLNDEWQEHHAHPLGPAPGIRDQRLQPHNPTDVTQTVIGDAASGYIGWDNPGSGTEQISVSRSYTGIANGFTGRSAVGKISFTLPVSIPPGQSRLVRVMWTSDLYLSPGGSWEINQLDLRVRVGWFTKTEVIPQQSWYLVGPSHGRCV